jgi:hypothetical protein
VLFEEIVGVEGVVCLKQVSLEGLLVLQGGYDQVENEMEKFQMEYC